MLFDLPDSETLYAALLARNPDYDGQAFVCVATTGVFCRLTCPARKPLAQNCTFRATIGECIEAGFRPCKRCHPLEAAAKAEPVIDTLLTALDRAPAHRWSEEDVTAMGLDASTVRRAFKRHFGMTFLELARQRRLREGFTTLASGGAVIEAQLEARFESPSAFRAAFARLLGCAPGELKANSGLMRANWIPTPLGDMIAVASAHHLHLLEFVDRKGLPAELKKLQAGANERIGIGPLGPTEQASHELGDYFAARSGRFETPLAMAGTPFTRQVWEALRTIPPGETRSYGDLARQIGRPSAVRAVARANGANQIALMIPCHRVIGADGSLTGYAGGLWRKQRLIEIERALRGQDGAARSAA
ncbi:trifunctional transcriptional activator/DNA repair protein Ada/methylated-DNA--[protein]-cysteine S-methyltransferase [Novosphingobium sp. 1949]|uniref:Trifunctional transcriptional activator/DNA repair protein Ada/methylated-DNA--[protein]-cysteine S-methyltransferase n=1 Tax=Novosphingobium organovorum TaxID=2930092 RepID=A0ABT0BIL9_9SPHN|nr:trifunctional transcriptional activator/DNA repair protein Ada/methylated-DNA--[protein]-cysteine S-methyltransferase [Novosphingobium organovorum]MCJ2184897.1 trifunctional transcriptional activator/DNA repair protein Ada/methylated-DNA--[protein]-cysteine S-methyltransferase [Novosphingobium organovorum]